jgi:hypothetical protein
LSHLALGEEPIGDPALIEHLDRARVKTAGPGADEHVIGPPLDEYGLDPGQRQLGRHHHPSRAGPGDRHRMFAQRKSPHFAPPVPSVPTCGGRLCGIARGFMKAPGAV